MKKIKKYKVLIIGSTGFIGRNFVDLFLQKKNCAIYLGYNNKKVSLKTCKTLKINLENSKECLKKIINFDIVINCAGYAPSASYPKSQISNVVMKNLIFNFNVINACTVNKIKKLMIFSSGTTSYPDKNHSMVEQDMFKNDVPKVYYTYGWSRRYLEILAKDINNFEENTRIYVVRPSAVFGKYDKFSDRFRHVVPDLILKVLNKNKNIEVWGDGSQIRDFMYSEDFAKICRDLVFTRQVGPINICSGKPISILALLNKIQKICGTKKSYNFLLNKPIKIQTRKMSNKFLKKIFPKTKITPLELSILKTVNYYKNLKS